MSSSRYRSGASASGSFDVPPPPPPDDDFPPPPPHHQRQQQQQQRPSGIINPNNIAYQRQQQLLQQQQQQQYVQPQQQQQPSNSSPLSSTRSSPSSRRASAVLPNPAAAALVSQQQQQQQQQLSSPTANTLLRPSRIFTQQDLNNVDQITPSSFDAIPNPSSPPLVVSSVVSAHSSSSISAPANTATSPTAPIKTIFVKFPLSTATGTAAQGDESIPPPPTLLETDLTDSDDESADSDDSGDSDLDDEQRQRVLSATRTSQSQRFVQSNQSGASVNGNSKLSAFYAHTAAPPPAPTAFMDDDDDDDEEGTDEKPSENQFPLPRHRTDSFSDWDAVIQTQLSRRSSATNFFTSQIDNLTQHQRRSSLSSYPTFACVPRLPRRSTVDSILPPPPPPEKTEEQTREEISSAILGEIRHKLLTVDPAQIAEAAANAAWLAGTPLSPQSIAVLTDRAQQMVAFKRTESVIAGRGGGGSKRNSTNSSTIPITNGKPDTGNTSSVGTDNLSPHEMAASLSPNKYNAIAHRKSVSGAISPSSPIFQPPETDETVSSSPPPPTRPHIRTNSLSQSPASITTATAPIPSPISPSALTVPSALSPTSRSSSTNLSSPTSSSSSSSSALSPTASSSSSARCQSEKCTFPPTRGCYCLRHAWKASYDHIRINKKALLVAKEIISTEKTYLDGLKILYKGMMRRLLIGLQMENKNSNFLNFSALNLTKEDIALIFSNIGDIYKLSVSLLEDFEESNSPLTINKAIGSILLFYAPRFLIYQTYLENYDEAIKKLSSLRKSNNEFDSFVKWFEKCEGMNLESFLILPVQRLPRYLLLLNELDRKLVANKNEESNPEDEAAREDIKAASEKIRLIAEKINSGMKEKDEMAKISLLDAQFERDDRYIDLVARGRSLLRQGPIKKFRDNTSSKFNNNKGTKPYMFFLFSDILVYASATKNLLNKNSTYKLKSCMLLSDISITSVADLKGKQNEFMITMLTNQKNLHLCCVDQKDRDGWIKSMTERIRKLQYQQEENRVGEKYGRMRSREVAVPIATGAAAANAAMTAERARRDSSGGINSSSLDSSKLTLHSRSNSVTGLTGTADQLISPKNATSASDANGGGGSGGGVGGVGRRESFSSTVSVSGSLSVGQSNYNPLSPTSANGVASPTSPSSSFRPPVGASSSPSFVSPRRHSSLSSAATLSVSSSASPSVSAPFSFASSGSPRSPNAADSVAATASASPTASASALSSVSSSSSSSSSFSSSSSSSSLSFSSSPSGPITLSMNRPPSQAKEEKFEFKYGRINMAAVKQNLQSNHK